MGRCIKPGVSKFNLVGDRVAERWSELEKKGESEFDHAAKRKRCQDTGGVEYNCVKS